MAELTLHNITKVKIESEVIDRHQHISPYTVIRVSVWNTEDLAHEAEPVEFRVTLFGLGTDVPITVTKKVREAAQ